VEKGGEMDGNGEGKKRWSYLVRCSRYMGLTRKPSFQGPTIIHPTMVTMNHRKVKMYKSFVSPVGLVDNLGLLLQYVVSCLQRSRLHYYVLGYCVVVFYAIVKVLLMLL
jgi:hypothetical protein